MHIEASSGDSGQREKTLEVARGLFGKLLEIDAAQRRQVLGHIPYILRQVRLATMRHRGQDRKSTRLNSSHSQIPYAVFCLKKKKKKRKVAAFTLLRVQFELTRPPRDRV